MEVIPEKRTATVKIDVIEKDQKKSEDMIAHMKKMCKELNITIVGSKANMDHEFKNEGFFFKTNKEEAKLSWKCFIEGSTGNISILTKGLYDKYKSTSPKIDYVDEDPSEAELAESEKQAIAKASKRVQEQAAQIAQSFGISLGKLLTINVSCHKTYDRSVRDDFAGDLEMGAPCQAMGKMAFGAAPVFQVPPQNGRQIVKMVATVNCEYALEQWFTQKWLILYLTWLIISSMLGTLRE